MPFVSKRQNRWAWATRQKFRRRWADETSYGDLPERAAKAEDAEGAAPAAGGAGPGGKPMTPAERARHAALVRWGKKNPFAQRLAAVRARKKKGKAGAAPKPDKTAEKEAQRQKNLAAAAEALMDADAPIGKVGLDALGKFAAGEALDPGMAKQLAALGVVTVGADGTPRLNSAGRSLLRAAEKGDARAVVDAAFAAGERVGVGAAGETLPGWEQGPDGTRSKVKAPKAGDKQAEAAEPGKEAEQPKGGGGGGGGKEAKPTPEEKKQQQAEARAQAARDTAEAVGLAAADADALRSAAEGQGGGTDALRQLGLVGEDGLTTDAGRRALLALERGDQRGYQAALQDVRAAQGRAAATEQRKAETAAQRAAREAERAQAAKDAEAERVKAERNEVTALLDDWEAGRHGLTYRDQRRAVRAGLARYDDAGNIRRVKPQSEVKAIDGWRWEIKRTYRRDSRGRFAGGGGGSSGGGRHAPSGQRPSSGNAGADRLAALRQRSRRFDSPISTRKPRKPKAEKPAIPAPLAKPRARVSGDLAAEARFRAQREVEQAARGKKPPSSRGEKPTTPAKPRSDKPATAPAPRKPQSDKPATPAQQRVERLTQQRERTQARLANIQQRRARLNEIQQMIRDSAGQLSAATLRELRAEVARLASGKALDIVDIELDLLELESTL